MSKIEQCEVIDSDVIKENAVTVKITSPDAFLTGIGWNKTEIEETVKKMMSAYDGIVYGPDTIKQAKTDRAKLNKLIKAIDDKRKEVKTTLMAPYEIFEDEINSVKAIVEKNAGNIDKQIKEYENEQKQFKKNELETTFRERINKLGLNDYISFDQVFEPRYLNSSVTLAAAWRDIAKKLDNICSDVQALEALDSKFITAVRATYFDTLDLGKALAENKRLCEQEEADLRRKEQEALQKSDGGNNEDGTNDEIVDSCREVKGSGAQVANVHATGGVAETTDDPEEKSTGHKTENNADRASDKPSTCIEQPKYTMPFTVRGTLDQLKMLKSYIIASGIEIIQDTNGDNAA